MMQLSFMSANLVARELGYRMPSWDAGDRATQAAFAPIDTFEERFDELLGIARHLGFGAIDLWNAHLDPDWATERHLAVAVRLLERRGLQVASVAGWFGSSRERFAAACRLAVSVGAPVLGGTTSLVDGDREFVIDQLRRSGLRLGIENHPERSPAEMLARIADGGGGTIGTTVDTGWYGTHGYDAARAIAELAPQVVHVHLKDVSHAGQPHTSCAHGEGVVPLRECVAVLRQQGYAGAISIEHGPADHDPTPAIAAARETVQHWLDSGAQA